MFLADGRVLIVNNDLYQEVMKKGIIIDLNEKKSREDSRNIPLTFDEESKERLSIKTENSRSVTQAKKLKKSSITTKKAQASTDQPSIEGKKKRSQVPFGKDLLSMLDNKEFSDITI